MVIFSFLTSFTSLFFLSFIFSLPSSLVFPTPFFQYFLFLRINTLSPSYHFLFFPLLLLSCLSSLLRRHPVLPFHHPQTWGPLETGTKGVSKLEYDKLRVSPSGICLWWSLSPGREKEELRKLGLKFVIYSFFFLSFGVLYLMRMMMMMMMMMMVNLLYCSLLFFWF